MDGLSSTGGGFGRRPDPFVPPGVPEGPVNITDPDSRNLKCPRGYEHCYNAQAVVTEEQIVIAGKRKTARPGWQGGRYTWMRYVPATENGHRLYRRRQATVEPVVVSVSGPVGSSVGP